MVAISARTQITVTGGEGQLATELRAYFPLADYPSRRDLDVSNPGSCRNYFAQHKPTLVLHCAAETAWDAPAERLLHTNVIGTAHVTFWAQRLNARLVYTSTDYVYGDGGNWNEGAALKPIGMYAQSKAGGEMAAGLYDNTLIVRGSWYSGLSYAKAATDAYTSKMPVARAAAMIATLSTSAWTGIVNVGGPRRSLYEICVTEFNPSVQPVTRNQVQLPYTLPGDVSLNCQRMRQWMGMR